MGDAMNQTEQDSLLLAMQRVHRWRMAFFGLVILLAGLAIGASLTLILGRGLLEDRTPGPERAGERMMRDLRHHLDLSPEQAEELEPILKKHMEALHKIRTAVRPQIIEQLELMNDEISSVLSEQQQSLWQRHFQRLQRDLREAPGPGRHRPPPPPGGRGPGRRDAAPPRQMDRPR